ncbi:MAG: squalene--hopene cyclase [Gemmataceae bacterium]|nr:squalene--hopene cyclase [Gemmataceae bacterium]
MTFPDPQRLDAAYQTALAALLAERTPEGHWVGELSTSALSTATAVSALALVQKHVGPHNQFDALIGGGLEWLATHQNADGGWGDTFKSVSNISTSMLCRAAFHLTGTEEKHAGPLLRVEGWLGERYGQTPEQLAEAVRARYGKDRTFSVPILTMCALAGLVSWLEVPPLPFELACFPQSWFRLLRLHVVSYALPALIAIGQAIHHHRKPWNPLARLIRWAARRKSLKVLERIQPSNGGFLEATPLTSFVTMSLASIGLAGHPVARKGAAFIVQSVRPDGSWPIDTNLATWVTTLAANALAAAGALEDLDNKEALRGWLLRQQYRQRHLYTGAAPGGWAWTDLPGGVPDVDDTSGVILALSHIDNALGIEGKDDEKVDGIDWLCALQNSDHGWPTFCRGWGYLPFDRSGADLTAHAIRAIRAWREPLVRMLDADYDGAWEQYGMVVASYAKYNYEPAFSFFKRQQRPDGSWLPLWFGNQHAPDDSNPTYGTARVLAAYRDLDMMNTDPAHRGVAWLLSAQNPDGGWGGAPDCPSSVEETALAVEVLLDAPGAYAPGSPEAQAVNNGLAWLVRQVEAGGLYDPAPIGFYFARLWYFEKLYPIIFTVAALGRARQKLSRRPDLAHREGTPT